LGDFYPYGKQKICEIDPSGRDLNPSAFLHSNPSANSAFLPFSPIIRLEKMAIE
jgi:hypothetical protein